MIPFEYNTVFIYVKKAVGILIGIALNMYITLDSIDILTTLALLIHDHDMSFHLSVSFFNLLRQFSTIFSVQFFISLVKFITNHLIVLLLL